MLTIRFDRLGVRPGDLVLDAGAGFGRHAFELARLGAEVVALDYAADEVVATRGTFGAMVGAGLRVQHVGRAQASNEGVDQACGILGAATGLGKQRFSGRCKRCGVSHRQPQFDHRGDQRDPMHALAQHARQMRQRAHRLREQDIDRGGRSGVLRVAAAPALVLQRQPVALGAQLVRGQPADQLQQQLFGRGQHAFCAVDAAGQLQRHVKA